MAGWWFIKFLGDVSLWGEARKTTPITEEVYNNLTKMESSKGFCFCMLFQGVWLDSQGLGAG
jgi:hypothetical protein